MTNTRINHTGHDHPNTSKARAACRKDMAAPAMTLAEYEAAIGELNAATFARVAAREAEMDDAFAHGCDLEDCAH